MFNATCFNWILETFPAEPVCWINDPVKESDPDTSISYASAAVNAWTDWETCDASIVCPVAIPFILNFVAIVKFYFIINIINLLSIYIYQYSCVSIFWGR